MQRKTSISVEKQTPLTFLLLILDVVAATEETEEEIKSCVG